jgi:hypothetical protein
MLWQNLNTIPIGNYTQNFPLKLTFWTIGDLGWKN